ncbi:phosphoribosylformylglycinamidine synthase [Phragmitibacter flavus]|uniref:Phosphoribosylformylglycinamidine synthase n=1 Tax=Phragmitibacter flavus TaxID=2576071 RepID=A0A5R8KCF1_9BACT|nr:phosphoribosylformylglycinamidine synthase subunit PurQ [Phragmitibacter flavus]TLD69982.1 phosphoribosylformylglycinamidine synthase [Phragmitibacter flavus]
MSIAPKALLLKFPGTNCDAETALALQEVGFETQVLPSALLEPESLEGIQLVVFSGGFSYGDYVMSGRFAKLTAKEKLGDGLKKYVEKGGYALGICNGFQILTQMGLLPEGSLIHNTSGRFICRWAGLKKNAQSPYLSELPDEFELPVAHAEGRFVGMDDVAGDYVKNGQAALLYDADVNGSSHQIAGLQDETGRVFGLMPHPERFMIKQHHYDADWTGAEHGWGHYLFKSVRAAIG